MKKKYYLFFQIVISIFIFFIPLNICYSQEQRVGSIQNQSEDQTVDTSTDQQETLIKKVTIDKNTRFATYDVDAMIKAIKENGDVSGDVEELIKQLIKQKPIIKRKIALLPFHSSTISDSALLSLSTLFYNHFSKNNFELISPEEVIFTLESISSKQVGCYNFECSIKIGKEVNYDFIIEGEINAIDQDNYRFRVKIIQVREGTIIYDSEEIIKIIDADETFFKISQKSLQHIPVLGNIKSINGKNYIISLGKNDGIEYGDQLIAVQYINQYDFNNRLNNSVDNTIAIIKVNYVSHSSSSATIQHSFKSPESNDRVIFYPHRFVRLQQVDLARKQIDNLFRNITIVKKIEKENKMELQNFINKEIIKTDEINERRFQARKKLQDRLLLEAEASYNKTRNIKHAFYITTGLFAYIYWQNEYDPRPSIIQNIALLDIILFGWYALSNLDHDNFLESLRKKKFIVQHELPFMQSHVQWQREQFGQNKQTQAKTVLNFSYHF